MSQVTELINKALHAIQRSLSALLSSVSEGNSKREKILEEIKELDLSVTVEQATLDTLTEKCLLKNILDEIRIANTHLEMMTDETITEGDIER